MITALLQRNRIERVLRTEPPESRPAAGLIIVDLTVSPAILVNGGITIGSCVSSYTPAFTTITAGQVPVGVPIAPQAYLTVLNAVSIDPPRPAASVPLVET